MSYANGHRHCKQDAILALCLLWRWEGLDRWVEGSPSLKPTKHPSSSVQAIPQASHRSRHTPAWGRAGREHIEVSRLRDEVSPTWLCRKASIQLSTCFFPVHTCSMFSSPAKMAVTCNREQEQRHDTNPEAFQMVLKYNRYVPHVPSAFY